jgi:hypothetical protein
MSKRINKDAKYQPAALRAYCDRVGAVQRNFRTYVVRQTGEDGYPKDVGTLKINEDGKLAHYGDETFAPTDAEKVLIEAEVATIEFPKSITAPDISELRPLLKSEKCYEFRNHEGVIFVEERRDDDDGGKVCLPWSFWSDGEWRCMEPDGKLPLYGLDKFKNTTMRVMIHEGAKAAAAVQAMCDDPACSHPWINELRNHVHLGWPGGVNRVDHVDWTPIQKLRSDGHVILSCDHDAGGERAASRISRILRRSLKAIMFDDRFANKFDLADDWPTIKEWWFKEKHYRGPTMDDCTFPITFATKSRRKGKTFIHTISDDFADEWRYVEDLEAFVHREQVHVLRSRQQFNDRIKPFSDVEDTVRLFMGLSAPKIDGVKYRPGEPPGKINERGRSYINTFRPTDVVPIEGDPKPFDDFMEHLFPDPGNRHEVTRWIVTLVARPDVRMTYSLLLISMIQGVGKTTLGNIIAKLIGMHNVSFPSENDVTDSSFNAWIPHKRLAVVNEIYSGSYGKKAYNRLKTVITDPIVYVNQKHLKQYHVENYLHAIACSNSMQALHLDNEDRRWLVPRVTEELKPPTWWKEFYEWLRGDGYGIVLWYLRNLADENPTTMIVDPGEHAPPSTMKRDVIEEGYSPGMRLVSSWLHYVKGRAEVPEWIKANAKPEGVDGEWRSPGVVMFDVDLVSMIRNTIYGGRSDPRIERARALRQLATNQEWHVHPYSFGHGQHKHARLLCSTPELARMHHDAVLAVTRPINVASLSQEWSFDL